jgi:hypothetical protein
MRCGLVRYAHTRELKRKVSECRRMRDFTALFAECWTLEEARDLLFLSASRPWKKRSVKR